MLMRAQLAADRLFFCLVGWIDAHGLLGGGPEAAADELSKLTVCGLDAPASRYRGGAYRTTLSAAFSLGPGSR